MESRAWARATATGKRRQRWCKLASREESGRADAEKDRNDHDRGTPYAHRASASSSLVWERQRASSFLQSAAILASCSRTLGAWSRTSVPSNNPPNAAMDAFAQSPRPSPWTAPPPPRPELGPPPLRACRPRCPRVPRPAWPPRRPSPPSTPPSVPPRDPSGWRPGPRWSRRAVPRTRRRPLSPPPAGRRRRRARHPGIATLRDPAARCPAPASCCPAPAACCRAPDSRCRAGRSRWRAPARYRRGQTGSSDPRSGGRRRRARAPRTPRSSDSGGSWAPGRWSGPPSAWDHGPQLPMTPQTCARVYPAGVRTHRVQLAAPVG